MTLAPFVGHQELREQLASAIGAGRMPQVMLLTGPRGGGKQRLALWLAQRVLCEAARAAEPCGECAPCRKVLGLAHPDLHWFVPVPRPKAGESEKQMEEVAESLEGIMAERRTSGLWGPPDGMSSHGIASARLIQQRASLTAAEGGWRVFIIGRAERLVPQESSQEAANALLKLLEEPPPRSLFILTTAEPGLVLPTIRSRSIPIRLPRLDDGEVRAFLAEHKPDLATNAVVMGARGAIGAALASGDDRSAKADAAAKDFLAAVADGPVRLTARSLRQGVAQARGEFTDLLDALAVQLAAGARSELEHGGSTGSINARLAGIERVLVAREQAQGNVNPQLLLATLGSDLAALGAA
jgi:DNA polymerase-3 subunit delta'